MRRAIIVLVVLVGLLVAADFGSAALAESAVSRQMRTQLALADDPQVTINGFPFLTQAASGHYGSVDVVAPRLRVGPFQNLTVSAQLRDVEAPLSMLLGSGPKSLTVGSAEGSVQIGPKDLQRVIPDVEDLYIEPLDATALQQAVKDGSDPSVASLDPDSAARIGGKVTLQGQEQDVAVIVTLELAGGKAQLVPHDLRYGPDRQPVPASFARSIEKQFTVTVDPGVLPLKVTPTKISVVNGNLQVSGTATNLQLDGAAFSQAG
jgi:hypothetical protein